MRSILDQAGGSFNQRGETCRLRRHRPRPQSGKATSGRQEVGIIGILHGLTIRDFFSGATSFGWRGDELPDNRRGVSTEHPLARHICARTAHHRTQCTNTVAHATRVAQVVCFGVSKLVCHPRVMSHMLPHLPQNTSTRSLSPTSFVFRPSSLSLTGPISAHSGSECETLRDPRRSGGYTKSASPTGYAKLTQSGDFEPQGIELDPGKDLQPRRIELDMLGQIRFEYQQEFLEMTIKILSQMTRRRLQHFDVDMPCVQSRIHLDCARILKMENYEKCWPHRCMHMGGEKIMVLLKNPLLQGNQKQK